MNQARLKSFAASARRELTEGVASRLALAQARAEPIALDPHSIDELAYSWFNRLVALRYLELKGLVPFRLLEAASQGRCSHSPRGLVLDWLGPPHSSSLEIGCDDEEGLFRALLLAVFDRLGSNLPYVFGGGCGASSASLPMNLLDPGGFVSMLCGDLAERDFEDTSVLGWLYQYYTADPSRQRGGQVSDVASVTQLFTPGWIADYLVESSLGHLWLEQAGELEPSGLPHVRRGGRGAARAERPPEHWSFLDPACGSGHLLLRAYELFKRIYSKLGYRERDVPSLILERNLFGLEIDPRAAQLAAFGLFARAAADDPRILERGSRIEINVRCLSPMSGTVRDRLLASHAGGEALAELESRLEHARLRGSLIRIPDALAESARALERSLASKGTLDEECAGFLSQVEMLSRRYDCVVTNPPYLANRYLPADLRTYLKSEYKDGERDLFSAFILRCLELCRPGGRVAMMTPFVWMFIGSYEALRKRILAETGILSLLQLDYSGFEDATVPICCFSARHSPPSGDVGVYARLAGFKGAMAQPAAAREALINPSCPWRYEVEQSAFSALPGNRLVFWLPRDWRALFEREEPLGTFAPAAVGLNTGDNARFLRLWHEVPMREIGFGMESLEQAHASGCRWFPYNKGGEFRRWAGNQEYVIDWAGDGERVKNYATQRNGGRHWSRYIQNLRYMLRPGVTWSFVSSSHFGVRILPKGFLFDVAGSAVFPEADEQLVTTAYLCSNVAASLMKSLNPTLNFQAGNVAALPYPREALLTRRADLEGLASEAIGIAQSEWDERETSWGFEAPPFLRSAFRGLNSAADEYIAGAAARSNRLAEIDRRIGEIAKEACEIAPGLEGNDPQFLLEVPDRQDVARRLLSFAVGCALGRFSLLKSGFVFTGPPEAGLTLTHYGNLPPREDNLLPVGDQDDCGADSFVRELLAQAYGPGNLSDSMRFLAAGLGYGQEDPGQCLRRYFAESFYDDHLKSYRKRPIYLLFSSGSARAFQALSYLHRLSSDTLAALLRCHLPRRRAAFTDRLAAIGQALRQARGAQQRELLRSRAQLQKRMDELASFETRLESHLASGVRVDLSEGSRAIHRKFANILAPIAE